MIDVALLGTGGMMPLPGRFLASMLCRINGRMFLFDCGEGTQVSLKMLGWGFKNIDCFCFTHFHADHISGLPGLLLAIANAERTEPVRFYGPAGVEKVVRHLCVIAPDLPFPMEFYELKTQKKAASPLLTAEASGNGDAISYKHDEIHFDDGDLTLSAIPLNHRGPCFAYSLTLHRRGKFDLERAVANNIPMKIWSALQKQTQNNIVYEGKTYSSDMVLGAARKGLKLVYCTDTRPVHTLAGFIYEADLFICEGMYGSDDKQEKAAAHRHMTYREAAELAKAGKAGKLWLTHFSPAMPDPKEFLSVATSVFPDTVVGRDRMTTTLRFEDEEE